MKMYKLAAKTFIVIFSLLLAGSIYGQEPTNLQVAKQQLLDYHNSGGYQDDITAVTEQAQQYIEERVAANKKLDKPKKLAIVLDIDETSLSNYNDMVKMRFGGSAQSIEKAMYQGQDPAIVPTLNLYRFAKSQGIDVFFVTGRANTAKHRRQTEKNLKTVGYKDWSGLYMKPKGIQTIKFKSGARKEITEKGYDIIFNMGDQLSDLQGGYSDKNFKLPNPFYFVS